jgi:predicted ATPase/class 3 adenylate cyclase
MKCPKCQSNNRDGVKFCEDCGAKIELECPACKSKIPLGKKFCGKCGNPIEPDTKVPSSTPERDIASCVEPSDRPVTRIKPLDGERKHATVLFSDLSGYTAMSEKLDPEKVKDIMGCIFTEAGKIADKYDGTVEKFFGDEIMIIFGVPKAHEDDPVRAINVAREIHEQVAEISPEFEKETGVVLSMHTGISTGLVVTGDKYIGKSRHGLTGDTINLAKRLTGLAASGDIVVGPDTYHQSGGYFDFEALEPTKVKGKNQPVQAYRVISSKDQPRKIHRLQGVRAKLIGRKVEMVQLQKAAERLKEGQGAVFSIVGTAGTGKSRLVEEFKASLNPEEIHWREGHAYPYTQNIPYFPLINLLSRAFEIKEGDSPEKMREKIETGVAYLMGEGQEAAPYLGSLFSISYPEIDEVSPEFWKSKLQTAVQAILSALAKMGPTVICLEDLHWVDPSFLELIRHILSDFREPVLFLCIYRPIITLFSIHQITSMANPFQEILIQDLSASESQDMLESLLNTENIPDELRRFVQTKVEGNPFYLEEVVNSFIESKTLIRENGNWRVTRPITEADISASIHGIISARLDRLDLETKRILQQAAVIGRAFYYEILKKVSDLKGNIDGCLSGLERLDLIKTRSIEPDLEYIFKHAITQEVVYNGLLKRERREIHERIAQVVEQLFQGRLSEFYETLGFHYQRGLSILKAVDYLMKSGEKSLKKYAVEESHQYYEKAFDLLIEKKNKTKKEKTILIDLLLKWAYVFYYRGNFRGMTDLFNANMTLAESLDDKTRLGMFYAWLGWSLTCRNNFKDSYEYLLKALKIGQNVSDQQVIGYASTWLTWTCVGRGALKEAIHYGEKAQDISKLLKLDDQYLYFKSLAGLGFSHYAMGNMKAALEAGKALVDYGHKYSNIRSLSMGHAVIGAGLSVDGDIPAAIEAMERAIQIAAEPFYTEFIRLYLGISYISNGQIELAEKALQKVIRFSQSEGAEIAGVPAQTFSGVVLIAKGQMSRGFKKIEEGRRRLRISSNIFSFLQSEYALGKIFLQMVEKSEPVKLSTFTKNIGFLIKNVPMAAKNAEKHLSKAIEIADEIGAKGILGQAFLDLGLLHKVKKRTGRAKDCISKAIRNFEECEADVYLKQAHEEFESL